MSIKRTIITTVVALALVAVVAPGVTQAVTVADLMAQIAALQAQLQGLAGSGNGTGTGNCAGVTFSRNLMVGSTGSDVKCLQTILNSNVSTKVSVTGAGSPGSETSYFGVKTLAAVRAYQTQKGFTPANQVGPLTRGALNASLGAVVTPVGPITPVVGGGLTVNLAVDNPAPGNVANTTTVGTSSDFTRFTLTAGSGDVSISRLYVTRSGLSGNSAISNIKIIDAATGGYIGSIGSLNSNNQALITFVQPLVISANTSREFYIRATTAISTTALAGNTIILGVNSADITSNASSATGMATGNPMTVVTVSGIGSLTANEDGTTVDSKPNVGDTGVTLNQFNLVAGSGEDMTVSTITMEKAGTIQNSYLGNLTLVDVTKGTTLGVVPALNAEGKATWSNLNLVIAKGNTERFRIKADILNGPTQTANADIIDGTDVLVVAKGNTYGFYIAPTVGTWGVSDSGTSNGTGAHMQTVNGGALSIAKSSLTPATGSIASGDGQTLAVLDFNAVGEAIKVSALKVTAAFVGGMAYTDVTAVKVYDENGSIVTGPQDMVSGNTVSFTDTFIVPVGIHHYTIKAKLGTSVTVGETIQAGVKDPYTDITATGMTSNSSILPTPNSATANIYGNVATVKAAALTVTTNTFPAGRSVASGTSNFVFATVTLSAASSGEAIQVTNATIYDAGTGSVKLGDLTNLALYADLTSGTSTRGDAYETLISNFYNPASAVTTQAFPLTQTLTVPAGGFITIAVVGNLKSSAADTNYIIEIDGTNGTVTANGASTGTSVSSPTYSVAGAQTMTRSSGGTLTVSKDADSPVATFVLGNSNVTLAVFKLAANNIEDLGVTDITLHTTDSAGAAYNAVQTYYFYNGSTLLGTVAGGTDPHLVLSSGQLTVPTNSYVKLTVKADLLPVDGTSVSNADTLTMVVNGVAMIKTTGIGSGAAINNTDTPAANTMTVVKAMPIITVDSSSPSGAVLSPSTSELIAIFDVTAQGADNVTFSTGKGDQIIFQVSKKIGTSVSAAKSWTLTDGASTTYSTVTTFNEATGSTLTFGASNGDWTTEFSVGPNQTKKLYLYGNTSDFTTSKDSVQVYLQNGSGAGSNLKYSVAEGTAISAGVYLPTAPLYAGFISQP